MEVSDHNRSVRCIGVALFRLKVNAFDVRATGNEKSLCGYYLGYVYLK